MTAGCNGGDLVSLVRSGWAPAPGSDGPKIILRAFLAAAMVFVGSATSVALDTENAVDPLDFSNLQRPGSPNDYLVAPAEVPAYIDADTQSPRFGVSAAQLARLWVEVLEAQPRTRVLGISDDGLGVEAEQRSALFRFVDRISFRAVPIDDDNAGVYVYSRSQVGYWDLGVNQRRVERWLESLQQAASAD